MMWHSFRNRLLNCEFTINVLFGFRYSSVRNISHSMTNSTRCYNKRPLGPLDPSHRRIVTTRLDASSITPKTKVNNSLPYHHFVDVKRNWVIPMAYWYTLGFPSADFICHNALNLLLDILLKQIWKFTLVAFAVLGGFGLTWDFRFANVFEHMKT
jgi:hypothetical protein